MLSFYVSADFSLYSMERVFKMDTYTETDAIANHVFHDCQDARSIALDLVMRASGWSSCDPNETTRYAVASWLIRALNMAPGTVCVLKLGLLDAPPPTLAPTTESEHKQVKALMAHALPTRPSCPSCMMTRECTRRM